VTRVRVDGLEQQSGGGDRRSDRGGRLPGEHPNIPYTPAEIAESSIPAAQAGATVVHLHVREDDGTPSGRPELFEDVMSRIRDGSELITMVSTGGPNDMTIASARSSGAPPWRGSGLARFEASSPFSRTLTAVCRIHVAEISVGA
jgi:hypothetical protein